MRKVLDPSSVQEKLESGTNIKTINGESILGEGNIQISGGGGDNVVTTDTDQEITANKTFKSPIKINEIDNEAGDTAIVRYNTDVNKVILGNANNSTLIRSLGRPILVYSESDYGSNVYNSVAVMNDITFLRGQSATDVSSTGTYQFNYSASFQSYFKGVFTFSVKSSSDSSAKIYSASMALNIMTGKGTSYNYVVPMQYGSTSDDIGYLYVTLTRTSTDKISITFDTSNLVFDSSYDKVIVDYFIGKV